MKTTILKVGVFVLLLSLMGAGCEKEDSYEEISLEYSKCPCDHEANFIKEVEMKDVLLFDAAKTSFEKMKELTFNGERSLFVCYVAETDSTTFYSIRTTMMGVSYICNFPAEVKEYEISSTGINISFTADEFELCDPKNSIATNTYSNLVLTSLKKHTK